MIYERDVCILISGIKLSSRIVKIQGPVPTNPKVNLSPPNLQKFSFFINSRVVNSVKVVAEILGREVDYLILPQPPADKKILSLFIDSRDVHLLVLNGVGVVSKILGGDVDIVPSFWLRRWHRHACGSPVTVNVYNLSIAIW